MDNENVDDQNADGVIDDLVIKVDLHQIELTKEEELNNADSNEKAEPRETTDQNKAPEPPFKQSSQVSFQ